MSLLSKEEVIARLGLIQTQFDTAPISKYIAALELGMKGSQKFSEILILES